MRNHLPLFGCFALDGVLTQNQMIETLYSRGICLNPFTWFILVTKQSRAEGATNGVKKYAEGNVAYL